MSDYYVALMYPVFILLGLFSPFITSLGYLWVDTFYPQYVSLVLRGFPVAMVMGLATIIIYTLFDRRSPPRITFSISLVLTMAVWVTLTTTWAANPVEAWTKWDWAFKTVAFSALIPFFIRSRVQIEAFIQVFLFSCALHILPYAGKALLSGGGYGKELGFLKSNVGIEEGSTLSAVSIMFIPLILHLRRHSLIFSNLKLRTVLYGGFILASCLAPIATVARTAIVGFAVVSTSIWLQSRHKIIMAVVVAAAGVTLAVAPSQNWKSRISTIETYDQEASAVGRILVWKWTLNYVASHPLGGGFRVDTINHIISEDKDFGAKAFHSIYFEVLGEQGYPGFLVFMVLILNTVLGLRRIVPAYRDSPDMAWCNDLARAMFTAFLVLISCGAFIGIAFQPMIWYMFALTTCISEYVRRAQTPVKVQRWTASRAIPSTATARIAP